MRKWITLVFLIWTSIQITPPALALDETYQYHDAQGNLTFTNIPSQIPKASQKDAKIVHQKHLPPLPLIPETLKPIQKEDLLGSWIPKKTFSLSVLFLLLTALMFMGITMMGIRGRGKRIILRFFIMASLSAALIFFFMIQENPLSTKTTEALKDNPYFTSPIKKAKIEVQQIQNQLEKKKALLETIHE